MKRFIKCKYEKTCRIDKPCEMAEAFDMARKSALRESLAKHFELSTISYVDWLKKEIRK